MTIPDPTEQDLALDVAETFATAPEGSVERALCRRLGRVEAERDWQRSEIGHLLFEMYILDACADAEADGLEEWRKVAGELERECERLTADLAAISGPDTGPKFDGTYPNARTEAGAIEPPPPGQRDGP